MIKMYQTSWFGIGFGSRRPGFETLPDANWYRDFYAQFFQTYGGFSDLSVDWLRDKEELANIIIDEIRDGDSVLAVGAGIGAIESCLLNSNRKKFNLFVEDFADNSMQFISEMLGGGDRVLSLDFKNPSKELLAKFDLVYAVGVESCLEADDLRLFLSTLRKLCHPAGRVVLVSLATLELTSSPVLYIRSVLIQLARKLGLPRPQNEIFWAYYRSRRELRKSARQAGFRLKREYFISKAHAKYFMELSV